MPIYVFSGSLTRPAPNYRAANGRGISTFSFDTDDGALKPITEHHGIDDASWLTIDDDRRRLYAICEVEGSDQSWVIAFAIGADGHLTELNRQPTGGQTACHGSLSPDGKLLLIANYNAAVPPGAPDDAVAVFPLTDTGLGPRSGSAHHRGQGPNAARQDRSHAHCIVPSRDGRFAYIADLGLDRIVTYVIEPSGALRHHPASDFVLPPGTGPRHLVVADAGNRLFLVSELKAAVFSFAVDRETGALRQLDSFPIAQFGEAIVQPAGILQTNDDHLLIGLRECNEIVSLAVNPAGALTRAGRWSAGGATPRDFTLSPDQRHLLVANQDSDQLTVFPIDNGILGEPKNLAVGTPMAVAFITF